MDGKRLFRTHADCQLDGGPAIGRRLFVQHDQLIVVVDLEDVGGMTNTESVAFTLETVDLNAHQSILSEAGSYPMHHGVTPRPPAGL